MDDRLTRSTIPGLELLLAEDHQDTALSLKLILESAGHKVVLAADGPTAVSQALLHSPDAILLDIGLPRMNGYEVAKQLWQQNALKRPFLIAVTGYGQACDRRRSDEAGIDVHLVKPVDVEDLLRLLVRLTQVLGLQQTKPPGHGDHARAGQTAVALGMAT